MPLETPTPDGVLELFRDEIVTREAEIDEAYGEIAASRGGEAWDNPFPGVETLHTPGGPTLMRVTYRRIIDGTFDEADRIRHELRNLRNDIRAAIASESQFEFAPPKLSHVDRPEGLEVICYTFGVVRTS
jgi:hypothetical protein